MNFKKRIIKESHTEPISGPSIGPECGLASMLIEAINSEWETVDKYNVLAANARAEGFNEVASIIDEINTEENKHIGQIQELLKMISPNANAIEDGRVEAINQVDDDNSWYENN